MKKNITDQKGDAGKWVMASVKAMKARPVPWTACREPVNAVRRCLRCRFRRFTAHRGNAHLVEFILQDTRLQAQLGEAVFLYGLDDAVHLSVVRRSEVGQVDVRRDEVVAQDVRVEITQDLFSISAETNSRNLIIKDIVESS